MSILTGCVNCLLRYPGDRLFLKGVCRWKISYQGLTARELTSIVVARPVSEETSSRLSQASCTCAMLMVRVATLRRQDSRRMGSTGRHASCRLHASSQQGLKAFRISNFGFGIAENSNQADSSKAKRRTLSKRPAFRQSEMPLSCC